MLKHSYLYWSSANPDLRTFALVNVRVGIPLELSVEQVLSEALWIPYCIPLELSVEQLTNELSRSYLARAESRAGVERSSLFVSCSNSMSSSKWANSLSESQLKLRVEQVSSETLWMPYYILIKLSVEQLMSELYGSYPARAESRAGVEQRSLFMSSSSSLSSNRWANSLGES